VRLLQADCVLLVAAEDATCDVTVAEFETVWQKMMPQHPSPGTSRSSACYLPAESSSHGKLSAMDMDALATMDASAGAAFTSASTSDVRPLSAIVEQRNRTKKCSHFAETKACWQHMTFACFHPRIDVTQTFAALSLCLFLSQSMSCRASCRTSSCHDCAVSQGGYETKPWA
jgi:hypothetical protein